MLLLDEQAAGELAQRLMSAEFRVTAVVEEPYRRKPAAPSQPLEA